MVIESSIPQPVSTLVCLWDSPVGGCPQGILLAQTPWGQSEKTYAVLSGPNMLVFLVLSPALGQAPLWDWEFGQSREECHPHPNSVTHPNSS